MLHQIELGPPGRAQAMDGMGSWPGGGDDCVRVADEKIVEQVKRKYGIRGEFILFVGRLEPQKNIPSLLDAYGSLYRAGKVSQELVIAGERGWLYEGIFERAKALELEDKVIFPGFVPEGDLPALYSAASLLVYPSFYEGFGLPPLEAMACGTPVVTSNTSSLPEVVGEAGLMVDPEDSAALAQAIHRVLNDESLRRTRGPGVWIGQSYSPGIKRPEKPSTYIGRCSTDRNLHLGSNNAERRPKFTKGRQSCKRRSKCLRMSRRQSSLYYIANA